MAKIAVIALMQKVFHDGVSMVVLTPGAGPTEVEEGKIAELLAEGVIADPSTYAVAGARIGGFTDAGELKGPGDTTLTQPIGELTGAQERSLAQQSQATTGASDPGLDDEDQDASEVEELRKRVSELDEECDTLASERDAIAKERNDLQRQLDEAREAAANLDRDGDGAAGGSKPADPPALTGKNKAELLAIATAEKVSVKDGATNAEIVEAIEAARADADEAPAS
jgi:hypothetical protein